jgi:DNA repair exonuclease SbcCD ATPase subunit
MKILSLELECRSFKERQLITFTDGMTLINGHNPTGDTSSGVGKSTIPIAIAFALDFCDIPATELKNWETGKVYVHLKLQDGNDIIDIIRSPKLELIVNGIPAEGTPTAHAAKLKEILGVDSSITRALTYRPQRVFGMFLGMTDSKKKEFLTRVLNLTEVETGIDSLDSKLKDLNRQVEVLAGRIDQTQMMQANQQVPDLTQLPSLKLQAESLQKELSSTNSETNETVKNLRATIAQYDAEKQKLIQMQSGKNQAEQNLANIKTTVVNINKELGRLRDQQCWTCEREWHDDKVVSLIEQKTRQLQDLKASYTSARDVVRSVVNIDVAHHTAEFNQKIQGLYAEISAVTGSSSNKEYQLGLLQKQITTTDQMVQNISRLNEALAKLQKEHTDLLVERHIIEHSLQLLGRQGFLGSIFDEILRDIQTQANAIIQYIPNVEDVRIVIDSTSVTAKGKVNKSIVTQAIKDGKKVKIKSLSGGQQASLELATDLAVSGVIRNRSGVGFDWIILDEAMDGLDVNTKMQTLDIIKQICEGQVIIIDHSTEIKESFNKVINLQYDGKQTYVV